MIFATTLTVTAIKPRLFAEKGANSPFLQKPVKCTNSELENEASKGSHKTLQGQALAQPFKPPSTPHESIIPTSRSNPEIFLVFFPLLSLCHVCLPGCLPSSSLSYPIHTSGHP